MYGDRASVFDNISGIIFQVGDLCLHSGGVCNGSNLGLETFQTAAIWYQIRGLCILRILCREILSGDSQYPFGTGKISYVKKGVL